MLVKSNGTELNFHLEKLKIITANILLKIRQLIGRQLGEKAER